MNSMAEKMERFRNWKCYCHEIDKKLDNPEFKYHFSAGNTYSSDEIMEYLNAIDEDEWIWYEYLDDTKITVLDFYICDDSIGFGGKLGFTMTE